MNFKINLVTLLILTTMVTTEKSILAENRGAGATTGDFSWQKGKPIEAIDLWHEEAKLFHQENKRNLELETILKISQGYTQLGQFRLALLELEKAKKFPGLNSNTKALIKLGIGNAQSGNGNYKSALIAYQDSLNKKVSLITLNNLVKTLRELKTSVLLEAEEIIRAKDSKDYYSLAKSYELQANVYAERALILSKQENSLAAVSALVEWSKLEQNTLSLHQLAKGQETLNKLPPSKQLVYVLINWAGVDNDRSVYWLGKADAIAKSYKDPQLESYVLLELAYFYQKKANLTLALDYAKEAELKASSTLTSESYYRSQKLIADIYQARGLKELALEKYKNTIDTIDVLIKTVSSSSPSRVVKFNKEIQPIYEDTLKIILEQPELSSLRDAIVISDRLRLLQLNNYFGEDCFEIEKQQLSNSSRIKKNMAILNSIVLHDKVYFILRLPDGRIIKSEKMISKSELYESAKKWRAELNTSYSWRFRHHSRYFYDLIVKPFEAELASVQEKEKVLVFIHDGILRNLPMAALFDGKNYLVEKWAISSSIGLKMTIEPSKVFSKPTALVFGLSSPKKAGWSTIPSVDQEVKKVGELINSNQYLDSNFTEKNLSEQLKQKSYSVLHLATHGYFGGTAKTSYILAYDKKISVPELEFLLENSVNAPNLLVLSACETALGSKFSVLGLAGVAAKSGVSSTLGTLWQVADADQKEMINNFYTNLNDDLSNKAVALQKAQVKQIRQLAHPQKWAALNLIGN
ncbi:MAG: CHAT domain-containing protein [Pleurocapsa minor HA4230-MV1]|nr:CHAT domain-containing protein [Pleurocapsa minor HA4230-MV1]